VAVWWKVTSTSQHAVIDGEALPRAPRQTWGLPFLLWQLPEIGLETCTVPCAPSFTTPRRLAVPSARGEGNFTTKLGHKEAIYS